MSTPESRSASYARLAQAFRYADAPAAAGVAPAAYTAAFDPAVSDDACSLREGAHADGEQSGLFEELVRFYEFFGLGRDPAAEMPDHISVELEFMHYLTHLEAAAADRPEEVRSLWRAQHDFLARHLGRLSEAVQLGLASPDPRCIELVEECAAFVRAELTLARQRLTQ